MNNNQHAWQVTPSMYPKNGGLSDQIRFLIRYAILAPNSHNTQPWKFQVKSNQLFIIPDFSRSLPYSDRTHREVYLSLGCSLANILIASTRYNLLPKVEYFPESELSSAAVRLTFSRGQFNPQYFNLFPYLTSRRTNRGIFHRRSLTPDKIRALKAISDEPDIFIHLITQPRLISKIGNIMYEAAHFAFSDQVFKQELSQWVTPNISGRYDGMPLSGFGIPLLPSLFAPLLIKHMPANLQAKMDRDWVLSSSAMLIISGPVDDKHHWLKAGKAYGLLAHRAISLGLACAPMAAIIEHPASNSKIRRLLKLSTIPLFYARVGYPQSNPPHSPRRPVTEILV